MLKVFSLDTSWEWEIQLKIKSSKDRYNKCSRIWKNREVSEEVKFHISEGNHTDKSL